MPLVIKKRSRQTNSASSQGEQLPKAQKKLYLIQSVIDAFSPNASPFPSQNLISPGVIAQKRQKHAIKL